MERWVWRSTAQKGCIFGLSGLPMAPFLFEIGLDIDWICAKCLIFYYIFSLNYLLVVEKYICIPILNTWYGFKKKESSKNKWFRYRLQICIFSASGLILGGGQNFRPASILNSSWVPLWLWITEFYLFRILCYGYNMNHVCSCRSFTKVKCHQSSCYNPIKTQNVIITSFEK